MLTVSQSVLGYVRKLALLRAGDRVGIAVSGGADSVALLRILLELRGELGIVLSVVHLNHQLRGAESDADEQFVRGLAESHGVQVFCESREVKEYAAEKKLSLEAAAREVRYEFFGTVLLQRELDKIATAHTLDDQAETVLLKLARGAGTRGLAGIYPKRNIDRAVPGEAEGVIVRPLLATRRNDLELYLGEIGQVWREDRSNRDLRHMRNRIRHGILPRLERHVNPAVREALAEAAEIARAEEEFWSQQMAWWLSQAWAATENGGALDFSRLPASQPGVEIAVRRRLVRAAAESLGFELEFRHVEDVLSLSEGQRTALPVGWTAVRHKSAVRFARLEEETIDYEYLLAVPGVIAVPEAGIRIEAAIASGRSDKELLDLRFARLGLRVRNWRPGNRFWPSHTREPKKIKELLQDRHIIGDEKKRWPVVVSGDEVVWVRGLGVRRDFQASDAEGVLIRELPLQE